MNFGVNAYTDLAVKLAQPPKTFAILIRVKTMRSVNSTNLVGFINLFIDQFFKFIKTTKKRYTIFCIILDDFKRIYSWYFIAKRES